MNRNRMFTIIFTGIITIAMTAPASWAGSRERHQIEGFAIGVGALLLSKAIIDHHRHNRVVATPATHHYRRPHHRPSGYWQVQKEWSPATYKKVWNPGHYSHRGNWVRGRWIRIEASPGHWSKKRVWIPYR